MSEQKKILQVKMLGREELTYGDKPILLGRNSVTKATKLLLLLLHSGEEGIGRNKLMEELYGREYVVDAANNLRVTVHRLKKMLQETELPPYNYIELRDSAYHWSSPMMEVQVDALQFTELMEAAKEEMQDEKKAELIEQACELYQGEFLPSLSTDEWVLIQAAQYKKMYFWGLSWISSYLKEVGQYEKLLKLMDMACRLYPYDEWQTEKIACYIALGRYNEAMKEYEATAKLLFEELGVTPSEKMLHQFDVMSQRISSRPQILHEIKEGMLKTEEDQEGAFYCTAPSFRDAYHIMQRSMERSGQSIYIMLCTIVDAQGNCMKESEKLTKMSGALFNAIRASLRKCDSFTKYNPAQFLIMLPGINEENCSIVEDRIAGNFAKEHVTWAKRLAFTVSSLYDCTLK